MKPKIISKDELLHILINMINCIKADDSFEGSLEYAATVERHQFEVRAFWRVGNSEGQGGSRMVGEME